MQNRRNAVLLDTRIFGNSVLKLPEAILKKVLVHLKAAQTDKRQGNLPTKDQTL